MDEKIFEDGLVETAAGLVAGRQIQPMRVLEQPQAGIEVVLGSGQVVNRGLHLRPEITAAEFNVPQALLDLVLGKIAGGSHVEQVVFLDVELLELFCEVSMEETVCALAIGERLAHRLAERRNESGSEADRLVMLLDGSLDKVHIAIRGITHVGLDPAAEVVAVLATVTAGGALNDHAPDLAAIIKTISAEQTSFQIVMIPASALARVATRFQQVLHAIEGLLVDEWWMTPVVSLPFVLDQAEVVGVFQHGCNLGLRNGPGWARSSRAGGEAALIEFIHDGLDGRVPVGVQFEGPTYKWCPFRIDCNGADLTAVLAVDGVEIANRRDAEGAALLRLLSHFVGDVGAVLGRAVLVEGRQDAVHKLADGGVVDALSGRDECDSTLSEVGHDDGVVDTVTRQARQFVDDDVVDILIASDAFQ
ncbi:MAG: hypothetical protein PGN37_01035 [Mycobacterium kyogaense]